MNALRCLIAGKLRQTAFGLLALADRFCPDALAAPERIVVTAKE